MTKIDIISGFLGAGKTTLIGRLLSEPLKGEQVVLIENEFGEIGIDGGLLKDAGVQITEMNSGCICCTLVGDFGKALQEVIETYHPARILIEPSGVGKLSDVIAAVQRVAEHEPVVLNSFVTVVDAQKAKMYAKNFGEFFLNQIEHAVLSCSPVPSLSRKTVWNRSFPCCASTNKDARIVTTPWDQLTGAQLLSVMEDSHSLSAEVLAEIVHAAEEHEHHHHHDHDHEHHQNTVKSAAATTMSTSIITTTTSTTMSTVRTAPAAAMTTSTNMSTITTTMSMNTTTSTARAAPAAAMTTIIIVITMPTRSSRAGAVRPRTSTPRSRLRPS